MFVLNRIDDQSGGTLRAVVNLSTALSRRGINVTVAAPVRANIATSTIDSIDTSVAVSKFSASRLGARFGSSLRHLMWTARQLRRFDSVHIHSTFYGAAYYTALFCRLLGVRYYIWSHNSLDPYDLQKHRRVKRLIGPVVIRPFLNGADAVLCTTSREASQLELYGARVRSCVVPIPVWPVETSDGPERWREQNRIAPSTYTLLFLARLDPKKGLPRVFEAMAQLADLDVCLIVAGAGASAVQDEEARRLATELGVANRVKFLGWVDDRARGDVLGAANVFVLPSDNENFGIAVVEALLAGVPVVISDNVYLSNDLMAVGGARVVGVEPAAISEAVRELYGNRAGGAIQAEAGYAFAMTHFAPDVVVDEVLRVCGEAGSGR